MNLNSGQDYTFNTGLGAENFARLEMINGTTTYQGGNITIGSGGSMLVDNTTGSVSQTLNNTGGTIDVTNTASLTVATFSQSSGTTTVNGSLTSTNDIIITGGTVDGGGTITSPSFDISNTTIAAGNSPGRLTFVGAAEFDSTDTLQIEINGSKQAGIDYDQIVVTGVLTMDAGTVLDLQLTRASRNDVLTIIDAGAGSSLGLLNYDGQLLNDEQEFSVGNYLLQIDYDNTLGDVFLTILIPEPASAALLLLGAAAMLHRRRRR
jgi:hypothetical protein